MMTGRLRGVLRQLRRVTASPLQDEPTDGALLERFRAGREELAFEALVRRHGAMVLGVCQRILGEGADAEDAFQATFLVLIRRADSIRRKESVASWLYGVASRTALKARTELARRRRQEGQVMPGHAADGTEEVAWRELRPVLDEELGRLAEKYRVPVLLCYLQGRTYEEAARQLGWAVGTLSTRLRYARQLLQSRLTARGITLSVGLLIALLQENAAAAAVSPALAGSVVQAASLFVRGETVAPALSAPAVSLADGVLRTMQVTRLKLVTLLVLGSVLLMAGTGLVALAVLRPAPEAPPAPPQPARVVVPGEPAPRPQPAPRVLKKEREAFQALTSIHSLAFAPDNKRLAFGSGRDVLVWEIGAQLPMMRWQTPTLWGFPHSVAFSPDGKTLAVSGGAGSIDPNGDPPAALLDVGTGKVLARYGDPREATYSLAFSPDGKLIALGGGRLSVFETTGKLVWRTFAPNIGGVAFSPDSKTLAALDVRNTIGLWSATTGQPQGQLGDGGEPVHGLFPRIAFSPDGKTLASRNLDQSVDLWDLGTQKKVRQFVPPEKAQAGTPGAFSWSYVAFSPDGRTLLSGAYGRVPAVLTLYDVTSGKALHQYPGTPGLFNAQISLTRNPHGLVQQWGRTPALYTCVAYSPDGKLLATGGSPGRVQVWGEPPEPTPGQGKPLRNPQPDNRPEN